MGSSDPVKSILPFLQRADELQKHDPIVAYYCRLYAMDKGLKIPSSERTKQVNDLLVLAMNALEKDKETLTLGPDDALHVEGFAQQVFSKADKQDRAGRADISTAKTFYAAGLFFEVLKQFGELQPEIEQKQKYAAWKAADIRKALAEGRRPTPGPPGSEEAAGGSGSGQQAAGLMGEGGLGYPSATPGSISGTGSLSAGVSGVYGGSGAAPPPAAAAAAGGYGSLQGGALADGGSGSNAAYDIVGLPRPPSEKFPTMDSLSFSGGQQGAPPSFAGPASASSSAQVAAWDRQLSSASAAADPRDALTFRQWLQAARQQGASSTPQPPEGPLSGTGLPMPRNENEMMPFPAGAGGASSAVPPSQGPPFASAPPQPAATPDRTPVFSLSSSDGSRVAASQAPPAGLPSSYSASTSQLPATHASAGGSVAPEKIAEAHKAARFAVSALAFDDVPAGVEYLKKALALLTS